MRFPLNLIAALHLALVLSAPLVRAEEDPSGVHLRERSEVNGVTLFAENNYTTDYTLTVRCDLINATSSQPFPLTVVSKNRKTFELVRIQRKDPRLPWKYTFSYSWKFGQPRSARTNDAIYQLPFRAGEFHHVNQGALGKFSHFAGTGNEQAIDWGAAEGTLICAARSGVVTAVRDDLTAGGTDPKLKTAANFIIIRHDDGTYAEYLHLQPHGALVRLGDKVNTGQPIAKSGNTGFSDGPHIHFVVFQPIDGESRLTLPSKFQTRFGILTDLKEGESY